MEFCARQLTRVIAYIMPLMGLRCIVGMDKAEVPVDYLYIIPKAKVYGAPISKQPPVITSCFRERSSVVQGRDYSKQLLVFTQKQVLEP